MQNAKLKTEVLLNCLHFEFCILHDEIK